MGGETPIPGPHPPSWLLHQSRCAVRECCIQVNPSHASTAKPPCTVTTLIFLWHCVAKQPHVWKQHRYQSEATRDRQLHRLTVRIFNRICSVYQAVPNLTVPEEHHGVHPNRFTVSNSIQGMNVGRTRLHEGGLLTCHPVIPQRVGMTNSAHRCGPPCLEAPHEDVRFIARGP